MDYTVIEQAAEKIVDKFAAVDSDITALETIMGTTLYVPEKHHNLVTKIGEIAINLNEKNITMVNEYKEVPEDNTAWQYYCYCFPLGKASEIKDKLYRFVTSKTSAEGRIMLGVNLSGKCSYSTNNSGSKLADSEWVNPCEILKEKYPDIYTEDSMVYFVAGTDFDYPLTVPSNTLTVRVEYLTKISNLIVDKSPWCDEIVLFWGDSITAQGNNGGTFYGTELVEKHGMNVIVRGIGGQTYRKKDTTFYANSDGSYAGRYGKNGLTEAPEGTTEHLGYLCSWDRITTMIPDSIRESVKVIIMNGGTNDHSNVEDLEIDGVITPENPIWVSNSTEDVQWSESEYYNGGDYDINTFVGGIASAIMKLRLWCPNALVILTTPFPRWKTDGTAQYENESGLNFREMCDVEIATAKYMGCPVIDANATCNISGYNFADMVTDGVHPSTAGKELYGHALSDGFNVFTPN